MIKIVVSLAQLNRFFDRFLLLAGARIVAESVNILENFKWGVAVRNVEKMREHLRRIGADIGRDLSNVPIVSADATDEKSLQKMTQKAKVRSRHCLPFEARSFDCVRPQ